MSQQSASALLEPEQIPALSFDTPGPVGDARPQPFLAWEDAASYGTAAWLPQAEPQAIHNYNAKRFVTGAVISVLAMLALAAGARSANVPVANECRVETPPTAFGANAETQMLIRGGLPCPIWTRIAGTATVSELAVTVAPKNGSLTHRGRTGVVYRPAPHYHGSDVFEFAMRGRSTATVRVNVTVE